MVTILNAQVLIQRCMLLKKFLPLTLELGHISSGLFQLSRQVSLHCGIVCLVLFGLICKSGFLNFQLLLKTTYLILRVLNKDSVFLIQGIEFFLLHFLALQTLTQLGIFII